MYSNILGIIEGWILVLLFRNYKLQVKTWNFKLISQYLSFDNIPDYKIIMLSIICCEITYNYINYELMRFFSIHLSENIKIWISCLIWFFLGIQWKKGLINKLAEK